MWNVLCFAFKVLNLFFVLYPWNIKIIEDAARLVKMKPSMYGQSAIHVWFFFIRIMQSASKSRLHGGDIECNCCIMECYHVYAIAQTRTHLKSVYSLSFNVLCSALSYVQLQFELDYGKALQRMVNNAEYKVNRPLHYTLSHPENNRDVTERAQGYTQQDASFMRQSRCSFLNHG